MKAELVPENGDPPIRITKDVTVIGRREFCDVRIDHPSLSKRHAVVVRTDGLLVVRDLATTNGTKVKGQRIRWAALLPDDKIAFGAYKLRVYLGPDDTPAPSERARKGSRVPGLVAPIAPGKLLLGAGFPAPTPSPVEILVVDEFEGLEILDAPDVESASDWRQLIARPAGHRAGGDDIMIELD